MASLSKMEMQLQNSIPVFEKELFPNGEDKLTLRDMENMIKLDYKRFFDVLDGTHKFSDNAVHLKNIVMSKRKQTAVYGSAADTHKSFSETFDSKLDVFK